MCKGNWSELSFKSDFCISYFRQHYMKRENSESIAKTASKSRKKPRKPRKNCGHHDKKLRKNPWKSRETHGKPTEKPRKNRVKSFL
jgi:hypothetical protein